MVAQLIRRLANSVWLMMVLFIFLICALYFVANTAEHLDSFGQSYHWLMLATATALAIIGVLIIASVWRLIVDLRQNVSGSRLTLKLVVMLVVMAMLPMFLVYSFSIKFLRSNIDSWFDVEVERALDDALGLSRDSLAVHMRTRQKTTVSLATRLSDVPPELAVVVLNDVGLDSEASELTIIGPDNRIIASTAYADSVSVVPERPADDIVSRAREGEPYLTIDPLIDGDLQVRSVVPIFSSDPISRVSVLYATYPVPRSSSQLAANVQESFRNYRQLSYLREPLKQSSIATLTLAVFLSLMMAVWVAFYAARRLMVPVHELVDGTRLVAAGDYSTRLHTSGRDELGYLVQSFNAMTDKIEAARASATSSQQLVEEQRSYLELVLSRISSGVITLDENLNVRTCNDSAAEILNIDNRTDDNKSLSGLSTVKQLLSGVNSMLVSNQPDWSTELELFQSNERTLITCRGTRIQGSGAEQSGHVLVFDDFSEVVEAQRNAAWSEVARRLAHEIKNPLTPIQLSAERLQHKYKDKLHGEDAVILSKLTNTIVQQVESMKSMVKAFADYASTPQTDFVPINLNELITETSWLYRDGDDRDAIVLQLDAGLPPLHCDPTRIRQVLHNVIKNAFETLVDDVNAAGHKLVISTRAVVGRNAQSIELLIEDNGPGFAAEVRERLFEPYVTTKTKGTGLGLAIVKKIVEEHGGKVRAENGDGKPPFGGGRIVLTFPLSYRQNQLPGPLQGPLHGDAA